MLKALVLGLAVSALLSANFARAEDKKFHIVFLAGDHEYGSSKSMPVVAKWMEGYGFKTTMLHTRKTIDGEPEPNNETNLPGLEKLAEADMAVIYFRWRQLPKDQVELIQKFIESGKPLVGFRTTSHSFNYPAGHELQKHWNAFGEWAMGTPPGWGAGGHTHHGHKASTDASVIPDAADHPILKGVAKEFHVRSWLYTVAPNYPPKDAKPLLMGKAVDSNKKDPQPEVIAWTWKNKFGGNTFYTSMGHPEDFDVEPFRRLVVNAIHWAAGKPSPEGPTPEAPKIKYGH